MLFTSIFPVHVEKSICARVITRYFCRRDNFTCDTYRHLIPKLLLHFLLYSVSIRVSRSNRVLVILYFQPLYLSGYEKHDRVIICTGITYVSTKVNHSLESFTLAEGQDKNAQNVHLQFKST